MNATSQPANLERAIGYVFSQRALLSQALSHRSVGRHNNERLEFLGDSILNHLVAEHLYGAFPRAREGSLSRMRAEIVKGETLAAVARELNLGDYLALGPGELKSGGHRRDSILADALEALTGAILIDGGLEACRRFVMQVLGDRLGALQDVELDKDPKTRLQEYLQSRGLPLPEYQLLDVSGSDHDQEFRVTCRLAKPKSAAEGTGRSIRRAEQAAAKTALGLLNRG
ncbi:ribonuclease III [Chromatocurvus halotolerans]|uniref:Ribonuclease 3 n=1 Tax=Chromatocurvus halotolerans TaxID=1132028 RepID=A0A4V2SC57_9GAMM|nr:ribonuclease III [Chromatocurvus halotolerans]TCO77730.1 RNAse III [Chromatocurvus halotolerans]